MSVEDIKDMLDYEPDSMKHYGKKGMKWGHRKGRSSSSGPAKANGEKFAKKAPKDGKKMSDQELKKVIARMQLESQYKTLTAPKKNAGKAFIKDLLVNTGKQQASALATKGAQIAISAALGAAAGKTSGKVASTLLTLAK